MWMHGLADLPKHISNRIELITLATMKRLITLLFTLLPITVIAAEPTYTCSSEQGCYEEQGPLYDIGRGAKLTLPLEWRFYSYPTAPLPIMEGLREVRAVKEGMVIAITPMPNINQRVFSENQLCEIIIKSAGQYVKNSKEKAIIPVPMSHDDLVGCYASVTADTDGERPFAVLPNRRYASVTTFVISYKNTIFSISVASGKLPDDDYLAAVQEVKKIE